MVIPATTLWGALFIFFHEPLAGALSLFYAIFTCLTLVDFSLRRQYSFLRFSQLGLGLVLPFLLMLVLGGFMSSSAVILWSFIAPVGALLLMKSHGLPG